MKVKKISDFAAFENAPDKKPGYTPPYKFRRPKSPDNVYDIVCPYFASPDKNIQFAYEPVRFAAPRLQKSMYKNSTGTTKQLTAPPEQS